MSGQLPACLKEKNPEELMLADSSRCQEFAYKLIIQHKSIWLDFTRECLISCYSLQDLNHYIGYNSFPKRRLIQKLSRIGVLYLKREAGATVDFLLE
ncbi:hypothetical protein Y1Q_0017525 [Alligator mississippiensis]|uniref:Uncharacterized protein n=1 Tax=Alligator mississippiensis TaxID=8496 RepID=A0A151P2H5_ALLMI|nr:hypothetical protein Y1Q_0017525 [Alligator mississippiensis]